MANVLSALAAGGTTGGVCSGNTNITRLTHTLSIADFVAQGGLTTEYAVLVNIPAGTYLKVWGLHNATALSMGSSPAISLGDSSSATLFVNAASTLTAGTYHTLASTEKLYSTANTLRLTLTGGTLASGTIQVTYSLISLANNLPAATV